jgi:hypothetical protein
MLHLLEVSFISNEFLNFLKKLILAESPTIQRPLTDLDLTTTTTSEQQVIIADGNEYCEIYL